jgi:polyphosphate glucokinase
MTRVIGIDIGGTGMKGAIVDVDAGTVLSERIKYPTPEGGEPGAITDAVTRMVTELGGTGDEPIGVCFPAIVRGGHTMSAANVSKNWIGLDADALFSAALGRSIYFVNDADAAGYAEASYGAARNQAGLVIMTTLGTGIGSALLYDGVLIPNSELGHLEIGGVDAEDWTANSIRERENLSFGQWAQRLTQYYRHVEFLFSPELFVIGGGISKRFEEFATLIDVATPIVPATLRNNAGIMGAAALAARYTHAPGQSL